MTIREAYLVLATGVAAFDTAALIYFWLQDHRGARPKPSVKVLDFRARLERHRARERGLDAIMRASRETGPT
jgi:hypothetical protein